MNHFVVTLLSDKPCELNRFLSQFSNQKIHTEEGTFRWSSHTLTALDCSLILSTLLDNDEKYQIEAYYTDHKQTVCGRRTTVADNHCRLRTGD